VKRWLLMSLASVLGVAVLAGATLCLTAGCSSVGYYAQSVTGHFDLLSRARPVPHVIADTQTPEALRERLQLSQRLRDYAVSELKLLDNASYRRYADLQRNAAVWNVVAAPELSLQLKTWCFPVVGCVGYRGYFDRADAEAEAKAIQSETLEVSVYGVPAYSTLGKLPGDYFADPLLNTFIRYPEGELARLIFHELAHQVVYAAGDTVFNESFATAVERIGGKRWLAEHADDKAREEYTRFDSRRRQFRDLTMHTRDELDAVYRSDKPEAEKRAMKVEVMAKMRADHEVLKKLQWNGFAGYDPWIANANNASLGVLAAYSDLVPQFERLFEREGRDFDRFYAEVKRLAKLSKDERRAALGPDNATKKDLP
jgi:predicted aminopeptidase